LKKLIRKGNNASLQDLSVYRSEILYTYVGRVSVQQYPVYISSTLFFSPPKDMLKTIVLFAHNRVLVSAQNVLP